MTRVNKQQAVSVRTEQSIGRTRRVRGDEKRAAVCHPRLLKYIEDINNYVDYNDDWPEEGFLKEWADKLEVIAAEYEVSPVILCRFFEWYDDASITEGQLAFKQTHMPELPPEPALLLAGKYELSGGQISNIARKCAINYAVTGETADLPALESLCREERSLVPAGKPIGFTA